MANDADSRPKTTLEQELMFAVVKERYGHLLTDEHLDEVRKSVLAMRAYTEPLRAARLTNDVEPFSTVQTVQGRGVNMTEWRPNCCSRRSERWRR